MVDAPWWVDAGSVALVGGAALYVFAQALGRYLSARAAELPHVDYRLAWRRWESDGGRVVSPSFADAEDARVWRYVEHPEWRSEPLTLVRIYETDVGLVIGQVSADEVVAALER